jgi:hypothetical protein
MKEYIFLRYANQPNPQVTEVLVNSIVKQGAKPFFTSLPGVMITSFKSDLTESEIRGKLDILDILYDIVEKKNIVVDSPTSTNTTTTNSKEELQREMDAAVESEDYEKAATLRNKIEQLYGPNESLILNFNFFKYLKENMSTELSVERKIEILAELSEWSGGYDPTEMSFDPNYSDDSDDNETLNQYIENYILQDEVELVTDWFVDLQNGADDIKKYQ